MNLLRTCVASLSLLLSLSSCRDPVDSGGGPGAGPAATIPDGVFVAETPAGAIGVREAIQRNLQPGQEIVVSAVVGGRKSVFVEGRAILVAIDTSLKPCGGPDDQCPTPWDYCCESKDTLLANTLTVQVVDAAGTPISRSLKGVHGLKELAKIVVAGKVRSSAGSLVIDASKIHVSGS